jgi:hypothetical protein
MQGNMNCQEWSQLISKKLDGELTTPEEKQLREHLETCDKCREEEAVQARLQSAMQRMAAPAGKERYPEHLKKAFWIRTTSPLTSRQFLWFRLGSVAAVLLLAIAVLVLSQRLQRVERHTAQQMAQATRGGRHAGSTHLTIPVAPPIGSIAVLSKYEPVAAFRNVQDYWRGALRWMAVDGNQTDLGISKTAPVSTAGNDLPKEVIVVTLQYVMHASDGRQETLANPKFVLIPGEEALANLAPDDQAPTPWRYHVRAVVEPNGKIRVHLAFAGQAGDSDFSFTTDTLVDDGAVAPILAGATGDQDKRWALYLWAAKSHLQPADSNAGAQDSHL